MDAERWIQIPLNSQHDGCKLFLKLKDSYYDFARIWQGNDESLYCSFPNLNSTQRGISQKIQVSAENPASISSSIVSEEKHNISFELNPRISYHTSGQVNYHGFHAEKQLFEPLYAITKPNFFFAICFSAMETFKTANLSELKSDTSLIIDITPFESKVCDVLFYVVPSDYTYMCNKEAGNYFIINFSLFGVMVEFVDDSQSFNLGDLNKTNKVVKIIPDLGMQAQPKLKPNDAFLMYEHFLYRTKDEIILPPDKDGTIRVIYTVEMRRKPWVKIEFADKDLRVIKKDVKATQTMLLFKVRDKSGNIITDARRIKITEFFLDAEIYENEDYPPEGFF